MAKTPRAALTRIAATVTARYYPSSGATDGFFLDGRISGRREHRAADITLDREDRGFFYSVFAHLSGSGADDAVQSRIRKSLDRILAEVKQPGRNIDTEINELAECAVSVAGRITLQHDGVRQPYFAGIIVKDSELAAVTMGGGCAYLYRGDVLYPLTADDFAMEAIDYNGKPVSGLDVYCAGVAGTVRYSNIAQLQLDDCVIVCNKEIMDALGQREVLRMLYEAEDQADAAGLIMTAASAKIPGVPLQFMIGFVENITSTDRTARINFGRSQSEQPVGSQGFGGMTAGASGRSRASGQTEAADDVLPSGPEPKAELPKAEYDDEVDAVYSTIQPGREDKRGRQSDYADDYEDEFDNESEMSGRGRKVAFYLLLAAICIACVFAIWHMVSSGKEPTTTTKSTTTISTTTTGGSETETSVTSETTELTETTAETTQTTTTTGSVQLPAKYTVVSGDTLTAIARKFYGSADPKYIQLIMDANSMTKPDLMPGDILTIPAKP